MSYPQVRDELLAIFPQHNEEAIRGAYNNVVNDLMSDLHEVVLPACIELLLALPATNETVDRRIGGKNLHDFQNKSQNDNCTYPSKLLSDSEESESDDSDMNYAAHDDYRNKPRPTYRDPVLVTRTLSRSDEDSLLGYLSDEEGDKMFATAIGLDEVLDDAKPSVSFRESGLNNSDPIHISDDFPSTLLHNKRKRKYDIPSSSNIIDVPDVRTEPLSKKADFSAEPGSNFAIKESDLSTVMPGMQDYVKLVKENIIMIINDVKDSYLDELLRIQSDNIPVSLCVERIVDHLLTKKDYPKIEKPSPPYLKKCCSSSFTSPATSLSSSTVSSSDDRAIYNQQAVILLQNKFPKVSTTTIRKVFLQNSHKYTTTHNIIEKALSSIASGDCQVDSTVLKTLLKGKRAKIHLSTLCARLQEEVNEMTALERSALVEGDMATAVALNTKEYEDEGQAIECACCYSEVAFENMVQCPDGHLFCTMCLQRYSKEATYGSGKTKLFCMTEGCDTVFPLSQLRKALPDDLMQKYLERVQDEDIKLANLENLVKCPRCDFAAVMPDGDKVFRCQNNECMQESCRYCQEDWKDHWGVPCKEMEKKEAKNLRTSYEEKMTAAKVRKCWSCSTIFLKTEGCNKMTCRCGAKMCYICRVPKIDYKHFCEHPRNPGEGCRKCKKCSLWSDPSEDDDRAVAEIKKEAEEERLRLQGAEEMSNISIGPTLESKPAPPPQQLNPLAVPFHQGAPQVAVYIGGHNVHNHR